MGNPPKRAQTARNIDKLVELAWKSLNVAEVLRFSLDAGGRELVEAQALTNELLGYVQRLLRGVSGALEYELTLMRVRRDIREIQVGLAGGRCHDDLVPDLDGLLDQLGFVLDALKRRAEAGSSLDDVDLFESREAAWQTGSRTIALLFP